VCWVRSDRRLDHPHQNRGSQRGQILRHPPPKLVRYVGGWPNSNSKNSSCSASIMATGRSRISVLTVLQPRRGSKMIHSDNYLLGRMRPPVHDNNNGSPMIQLGLLLLLLYRELWVYLNRKSRRYRKLLLQYCVCRKSILFIRWSVHVQYIQYTCSSQSLSELLLYCFLYDTCTLMNNLVMHNKQ